MNEDFLHFIYKYKLWSKGKLFLTSGEEFEILDTGLPNYDSGPDFFNAKVKIKDKVWAGNVEIHTISSDWFKHKHHQDPAYENIVLHIVFCNNKKVKYKNGKTIPTWEIKFDHMLFNNYYKLRTNRFKIGCSEYFDIVDKLKVSMFLEKLGVESLLSKSLYIQNLLDKTHDDWEQSFYICLARNFGFSVNSLAFEQLAISIPMSVIRKYFNNIFKLEALLFGQSGLLFDITDDDYSLELLSEYKFLQQKHNLVPIPKTLWKMSKLRPANFPYVRIAQFAMLLTNFKDLFSTVTDINQLSKIKTFFNIKPSYYWKTHYSFNNYIEKASTRFGSGSFDLIIINTIAPFAHYYCKNFKTEGSENLLIEWLNYTKAENNRDVRAWKNLDIIPQNAFESQALIYLKKNYCNLRKCMDCNIGYEIMKKISEV